MVFPPRCSLQDVPLPLLRLLLEEPEQPTTHAGCLNVVVSRKENVGHICVGVKALNMHILCEIHPRSMMDVEGEF